MFSFISLSFDGDEEVPENLMEFLEHKGIRTTITYMVAGSIHSLDDEGADAMLSGAAVSMTFHAINEFRSYRLINSSELSSYFKEVMDEAQIDHELESTYKTMFLSFNDSLNFGAKFAALKLAELANYHWGKHNQDHSTPPNYWQSIMTEFNQYNKAKGEVLHAAFKLFMGLGFAYGKYRQDGDVLEMLEEPDPDWLNLYADSIKNDAIALMSKDEVTGEEYNTSAFDSFISDLDVSPLEDKDD